MKIITIIGTRPEIIKMSPLLELLNKHFDHKVVHSGQHYDLNLDGGIFRDLKLPVPQIRLKTGSGNFAKQFNKQVKSIFDVLEKEKPDFVVVQGDTNTALSGALVAVRLKIKVIHIEAGCRSGNLSAPEEQNRLMIDSVASVRFCSDSKSYKTLLGEGKLPGTYLVGSTALDAIKRSSALITRQGLGGLKLPREKYLLATIHRAENMEDLDGFKKKIEFLNWAAELLPLVFPVHPRTLRFLKLHKITLSKNIIQTPPQRHLSFVDLLKNCRLVISDSGGIQEEAAFFNRPCIVLRKETEWTRLVDAGKNFLFATITEKERGLIRRLIEDNDFYKGVQTKKCDETKVGASKKIIKIIKQIIDDSSKAKFENA